MSFAWQPSLWLKRLHRTIDTFKMKQFTIQNPMILPSFLLDAELSTSSYDLNVRLDEALYLLVQISLVTYHENSDSYSMHPSVHTSGRMTSSSCTVQSSTTHSFALCSAPLRTNQSIHRVIWPGNCTRMWFLWANTRGRPNANLKTIGRRGIRPGLRFSHVSFHGEHFSLAKCALLDSEWGYFWRLEIVSEQS